MLEAKVDGGRVEISAKGDVEAVFSAVCHIVKSLYRNYQINGRTFEAEVFRATLTAAMVAEDSPVWDAESPVKGVSALVPMDRKEDDDAES